MEDDFSWLCYPDKGGVSGVLEQGALPLVLYEDVGGPDGPSDPVLAFDLRDVVCVIDKVQSRIL